MDSQTFYLTDTYGKSLHVYRWMPAQESLRGIVQVVHGVAEHAGRYERLAHVLTTSGYGVYAHDHRGHGKTDPDHLGFVDSDDAFILMTENVRDVFDHIRHEHPDVPLLQLGHSMGSTLVMRALQKKLTRPAGLIYSGVIAPPPFYVAFGIWLASISARIYGPDVPGTFLESLVFGPYRNGFKPNRTNVDWLNRDEAEVDAYVNDPYCNFILSSSFYRDFLNGVATTLSKPNLKNHPREVPVCIISGDADPVGNNGKGVHQVAETLKQAGVTDLQINLYEGGRHEMLNETNRNQVLADMLSWIDKHNS